MSTVQLVRVPELGVPSAPFSSMMAPVEPVLIASAVATPVPNPVIPVLSGSPVQLVRVPEAGVPSTGVVMVGEDSVADEIVGEDSVADEIVGEVANTKLPVVSPAVIREDVIVLPAEIVDIYFPTK